MDYLEAQRRDDEERTKRLFVGFLSSALGVDQTYVGEDGFVGQRTGQGISVNPVTGHYSVEGQTTSSQGGFRVRQNGVSGTTLLLIAGLIYLAVN